ncbi:MAG TPA: maleylpyruvate isomerase N-terminal domain-containing protein [Acidimicrobiales bacterium]|nr:maleylpyruvate isomerase N-terminal domain-containing protein [Acidimicrobiales bacterium]
MVGGRLSRDEVDAYVAAVDWWRAILGRTELAAVWDKPSAVARYSVGGVAAHAAHGVLWLEQLLSDVEPVGLRTVSMGEFFGPNRVADGEDAAGIEDTFAASLRAAAEGFARTGQGMVRAALTTSRDQLVGLLDGVEATRAVAVIRISGAQVPLREYLRTRVLELVVHGDDLICSVPALVAPGPPQGSLEVSLEVCLQLAQAQVGGLAALRSFTRRERALPDALRVL